VSTVVECIMPPSNRSHARLAKGERKVRLGGFTMAKHIDLERERKTNLTLNAEFRCSSECSTNMQDNGSTLSDFASRSTQVPLLHTRGRQVNWRGNEAVLCGILASDQMNLHPVRYIEKSFKKIGLDFYLLYVIVSISIKYIMLCHQMNF
jgi:hypothetical protein